MRQWKSMLAKCMSVFVLAFLISCLTVAAFASTYVTGSTWSFTIGGNEYNNHSMLNYYDAASGGSSYLTDTTFINCNNSCPAGYLGAMAGIYIQNENGTYTLVKASAWKYSTSSSKSFYSQISNTYPRNGHYIGSGQTAVYYNGQYQEKWTYGTPIIMVHQ